MNLFYENKKNVPAPCKVINQLRNVSKIARKDSLKKKQTEQEENRAIIFD